MNYKFSLFLLALLISYSLSAQDKKDTTSKSLGSQHEVKINTVFALLSLPEISYERILNEKSSVGLSVGFGANKEDLDLDFFLLPYYRFFFEQKKNAAGFFIEGNLIYFKETSKFQQEIEDLPKIGFGVGAAVGYKLLDNNGLVIDFTAGLGKNFNDKNYLSSYFPRFGISIGKRLSVASQASSVDKKLPKNEFVKVNELRINIAYLLYGIPEITYERILKENSSIGLSFSYSITDKIEEEFFIIPHYRQYFGKQPASGFFVELGAMYWETKKKFVFNGDKGFGGEVAVGLKLRKIPTFPIELVVGFGRSFINNDSLYEYYAPRLGLSIGKQF